MMRVCVYCRTRYQKGSGITFHKFPSDLTKQLWLKNMKIKDFSPKCNDHLCSKHFTDDCFVKHVSRTSIKYGSVPTLFFVNTPSPCDDMATLTPCVSEAAGVKRELSPIIDVYDKNTNHDEASTSQSEKKCGTIPEVKLENIAQDHRYENTPSRSISEILTNVRHDHRYENSPRFTNKKMQRVKKSLDMSRVRVKVLSQHVRRLKITVNSLKAMITGLKKKNLIDENFVNMLNHHQALRPKLFKRMVKNKSQNKFRSKYPPNLR